MGATRIFNLLPFIRFNGWHISDGRELIRATVTDAFSLFSVASTRWGSRPQMELSSLFHRFSALVLCFVSAITLATQPTKRAGSPSSYTDSPELMYCLIASIVTFVYSALQIFKGVSDISHGAVLIPDRISDYLSFIVDQMLAYLLILSSSMGLQAILRRDNAPTLRKAAIVSFTMSFVAFSIMASCALLSGYKLCKRIIW